MHRRNLFLLSPAWAKGTGISPRVLHKRLLLHRQAREVRVWVEAKDKAYRLGLRRPRGVSTSLYHQLSQRTSQLYRVCFCYLAYGQGYYLILVHRIHSFITASCVRELGLEVETLENSSYVSSPLGTRVSVDLICRGYKLEISRILLTVDLRVMDMSEFDVILWMD